MFFLQSPSHLAEQTSGVCAALTAACQQQAWSDLPGFVNKGRQSRRSFALTVERIANTFPTLTRPHKVQ
jgi:hypothetical protein